MAKEKSAHDIIKEIKDEKCEYVDIRFCDLPGVVQHFSIPASAFDESVFEDGLAFDGSSVRGFQSIHESDMMLLPDPNTARIDPFRAAKTMNINFFVHDPFTREAHSRDPRNVARKAEDYLASTGIADTAYFGAEAEFYIFDSVAFDSQMNGTFYEVDSESGWWNSGEFSRPTAVPTAATGPSQGRLLPGGSLRPLRRSARPDVYEPDRRGLRPRAWPPRGGAPPARPRSTTSSTPCCMRPMTCCCSNTSSRTPPGRPARP